MKRFVLTILSMMTFAGCAQPDVASEVTLHNGAQIADDKYPAIVWVGNCTASFVSDTTLIYAAHCLGGSGRQVTVRRPFQARSIASFIHPSYRSIGALDVAVAIFPPGTAKNWLPIYRGPRTPGADIHMVGFGCNSRGSSGVKREGYNTLDSAAGGVLRSSSNSRNWRNNDGRDVSVCPGDSGGPLLIDGKVAGVTSYHTGGTGSGHPDLQYGPNFQWLEQLVANNGAKITNLDGRSTHGGLGDQNVGDDLYANLAETNGPDRAFLHIGANENVSQVLLCSGEQASCNFDSDGSQLTNSSTRNGDRKIFRFDQSLELATGAAWTVVGLDDNNKVLDRRKFNVNSR